MLHLKQGLQLHEINMTRTSALLLTAICVALTPVSDCQALQELTAKVGDPKVFTCNDIPDEYSCVWTTPQRLPLTPTTNNPDRYKIKYDKVAKTCTFTINRTIFNDTGIWECNDVDFAYLTVTAMPDEPFLQFDDEKRIKDKTMVPQSPVNLTCVSKNGHPAPSMMTWTVNGQEIQSSENITIETQSNEAITAKRYLTLNLDQATGYAVDNPDKEKKVTCTVKHVTGTKEVTKILGKGYLTTKVELKSSGTAIKGTESITLTCNADGLPVPNEYKITNKATNTVVSSQQNATVKEAGKYLCQARQENGRWVDSSPVEITDGNNSGSSLVSSMWFSLCVTIVTVLCFTITL